MLNKIAPPHLAESWDNAGLQVGDPGQEVSGVMVALEATEHTVESALASSCNLLVTHHPLIFKPLASISAATPQGRLIKRAFSAGLNIFSIHTSYDIAGDGLNDVLAAALGLLQLRALKPVSTQELVKLVVFVPADHLEPLRQALVPWTVQQGAYCGCSFAASGEGTFTPLEGARPFIGSIGMAERVAEQRLELLLDRSNLSRAIKALMATHPYQEPAFDIYPLLNQGRIHSLGRIGTLASPMRLAEFSAMTARTLSTQTLRYVGDPCRILRTVAICSGSGASLLRDSLRAGVDALVTGDVKYHEAREAEEQGIALVDAGHFATEIIMTDAVAGRLRQMLDLAGHTACGVEVCRMERDPFHLIPPT